MVNAKVVPFDELEQADLIVDAVYLGGAAKNAADDPLNKLTRCGNMGGFRKVGRKQQTKYVVLYSSQSDRNWPDQLDLATGLFTYFGDNKTPGSRLHDTTRGGNKLLARVFDQIHASPSRRLEVPPFLIFTKAPLYGRRAVQFRGLVAPGANGVAPTARWNCARRRPRSPRRQERPSDRCPSAPGPRRWRGQCQSSLPG